MHCPPGFGERPPVTGWYAEFDDLTAPPGSSVGYTRDAMRFMGATFDPSALYRFNAVRRMLRAEGLTTAAISTHVANLQRHCSNAVAGSPLGQAELLNPLDGRPPCALPGFPLAECGCLARSAGSSKAASPTSAATCCASALACIMTSPASLLSPIWRAAWTRASIRLR